MTEGEARRPRRGLGSRTFENRFPVHKNANARSLALALALVPIRSRSPSHKEVINLVPRAIRAVPSTNGPGTGWAQSAKIWQTASL